MIACRHCGESVTDHESIMEVECHTQDNEVFVTTDYRCPFCLGWTRGTQIGYIKKWEPEQLEAV